MSLLGRALVRAGVLPCIPPGTDNDGVARTVGGSSSC
jgi:hypothetical protein